MRETHPAASAGEQWLVAGGRDYIKVKGRRTYLYRAVDNSGQTIDCYDAFHDPGLRG
jgi:transposase-like protein